MRLLVLATALACAAVMLLSLGVGVLAGSGPLAGMGLGAMGGALVPSASPGPAALRLPPQMLDLYRRAATSCPGLPWSVLAGIGTVESSNGTSDLPGVHSGANYAGAEGPMQFEPGTFAEYDEPVPPGGSSPPSPYDPVDAVYAAARLLCANGAANGKDIGAAVFTYNHSQSYVDEVLSLARSYSGGTG